MNSCVLDSHKENCDPKGFSIQGCYKCKDEKNFEKTIKIGAIAEQGAEAGLETAARLTIEQRK